MLEGRLEGRSASIDRFNNDPKEFVFLLSTKAVGVVLTSLLYIQSLFMTQIGIHITIFRSTLSQNWAETKG